MNQQRICIEVHLSASQMQLHNISYISEEISIQLNRVARNESLKKAYVESCDWRYRIWLCDSP